MSPTLSIFTPKVWLIWGPNKVSPCWLGWISCAAQDLVSHSTAFSCLTRASTCTCRGQYLTKFWRGAQHLHKAQLSTQLLPENCSSPRSPRLQTPASGPTLLPSAWTQLPASRPLQCSTQRARHGFCSRVSCSTGDYKLPLPNVQCQEKLPYVYFSQFYRLLCLIIFCFLTLKI